MNWSPFRNFSVFVLLLAGGLAQEARLDQAGNALWAEDRTSQNKVASTSTSEVIPTGTKWNGYRGIWFTLGQFSEHGDKYSGGLGTYTSSHTPIAVYTADVNKTFFTYGGTTSSSERRLLIMAASFDHSTGKVSKPVVVLDKVKVNDPHDNASLQLDSDGYVWIFVSGRARSRPGFKYRSKQPYSVDDFDLVHESEMTYPQPWHVKGNGWLNLFTKYSKGRELYWETSIDGNQWTEPKKLAGMGGHYQVSALGETKIGTFFNYHPKGNVDRRTNVYYIETSDVGNTWRNVQGDILETPLENIDSKALVVDYQKDGIMQYACDLAFDENERPVMLYVTSRGHQPGPKNDPREFRITRWDGSKWITSSVGPTDHNYDMGSLNLEKDYWSVIVPSDAGPQPYGSGGEVVLFKSNDQGETWTKSNVTQSSQHNHNYVRKPIHAQNPFFYFWADGNPDKFSDSKLYFTDSSGEKVWQLPHEMNDDWESPIQVQR